MFIAPHPSAPPESDASDRHAAIARFYRDHAARLIQAVRRELSDPSLAEDGCQAAWTALLSAEPVPLDGRAFVWLRVTAVRAARRASRAAECPVGRMTGGGEGEGPRTELAGPDRDPLQRVIAQEALDAAWAQLRALTPRERRMLGLVGFGLSYAQIAALTGDSIRTIERQVLRGRRKLRG